MIEAQLDAINRDTYFIRPDVLEQLQPSLNQYFRYAELLVNGHQPRPVHNASRPASGRMFGSPMMQAGMMQPGMMQPGMNAMGSPQMSPNLTAASPNLRPNMMLAGQGRGTPQMQARPVGNAQSINPAQRIQMIQANLMSIQQQLQQIHQMSQGQITPEQMQNLQLKQQDLLRQQQIFQQQVNALNQMTMQSGMMRSPPNMRPNIRLQNRPPASDIGIGIGFGNDNQMNQFNQLQNNAAVLANQRMMQQQMYAQQMARGQMAPNRPQNMQQMQMLQQQQLNQQQQIQELLGTGDQQQNPSFLSNDNFNGSPQLKNAPATQGKGSPTSSSQSKSSPNNPAIKKDSTPSIPQNAPQMLGMNPNDPAFQIGMGVRGPMNAQMAQMGMSQMNPNQLSQISQQFGNQMMSPPLGHNMPQNMQQGINQRVQNLQGNMDNQQVMGMTFDQNNFGNNQSRRPQGQGQHQQLFQVGQIPGGIQQSQSSPFGLQQSASSKSENWADEFNFPTNPQLTASGLDPKEDGNID